MKNFRAIKFREAWNNPELKQFLRFSGFYRYVICDVNSSMWNSNTNRGHMKFDFTTTEVCTVQWLTTDLPFSVRFCAFNQQQLITSMLNNWKRIWSIKWHFSNRIWFLCAKYNSRDCIFKRFLYAINQYTIIKSHQIVYLSLV